MGFGFQLVQLLRQIGDVLGNLPPTLPLLRPASLGVSRLRSTTGVVFHAHNVTLKSERWELKFFQSVKDAHHVVLVQLLACRRSFHESTVGG
jgi:hypothetical protein